MAHTLQERFALALEAQGWVRDHMARSGKYWLYHHKGFPHMYLGRAGAIREGNSIATSVPISEWRKVNLLDWTARPQEAAIDLAELGIDLN